MSSKKKILVIEDDADIGMLMTTILNSTGYQCIYTKNGAEGIQKAFELVPDLILCDICMSPMDGYQVFNILSESSLTKHIPFIFISGRAAAEDISLGLKLGVDDYIIKPFHNKSLVKTVQTRLEKHDRLINVGRTQLKTLLDMMPNAVFLTDCNSVTQVNESFKKIFGYDDRDIPNLKMNLLFDNKSIKNLQNVLQDCNNNVLDSYSGEINIQLRDGSVQKALLSLSKTDKHPTGGKFIGLITPLKSNISTGFTPKHIEAISKVLKDENIEVSDTLIQKLSYITTDKEIKHRPEPDVIFSKREKEVLKLSCDGLPIKLIADKLCISDRTVEKYRASLMNKTGSKNIVEVLVYAIKSSLVEI
jgi:PAS domain S-box-containing protein